MYGIRAILTASLACQGVKNFLEISILNLTVSFLRSMSLCLFTIFVDVCYSIKGSQSKYKIQYRSVLFFTPTPGGVLAKDVQ